MLRTIVRTFLWGVLLVAFLSACAYALTFSSTYQHCITKERTYQSDQEKQSTLSSIGVVIRCEAVPLDSHAGAITALGTLAVAFFTLTLWIVTGSALRIARDEFNATHRPQIIVRDVRQLGANPGDAIAIEFRVINAGGSKAKIIASHFETGFFGEAETYKATEAPETGNANTIGNVVFGLNGLMNLIHRGSTWRVEDFHQFAEAERGFFFGGKIIYRDDIGNTRRVGIYRRLDVASRRFRPVDDPDYEYED